MCSQDETSEWTTEQDEKLIEYVKNHDILYNVHSKDFRKKPLKKCLWLEIGDMVNKTDAECCKRWSYVRDYYVRRRAKGIGPCTEGAKRRSKLLSFLDSMPSGKRSSTTNFVHTDNPENHINDTNELNNWTGQNSTVEIKNESIWQSDESDFPDENSIIQKYREDERTEFPRQTIENHQGQGVNDLFFASMAKIVDKLPERDQAEIRMKIGNLVGMAEIAYFSRIDSRSNSQYNVMSSSDSRNNAIDPNFLNDSDMLNNSK